MIQATSLAALVPFRMERVAADVERSHLSIADLDALFVGPLVEGAFDFQAGLGRRRGDQLDHGGAARERRHAEGVQGTTRASSA